MRWAWKPSTSFPKEGARLVAAPTHRLFRQSLRRPVRLLLEIVARSKPRGAEPAIGGPIAGLVIGVLRHCVVSTPGRAPRRIALEVIKNLLQDGLVALSDPLGLGEVARQQIAHDLGAILLAAHDGG